MNFVPANTALVLIDLQKGIVCMNLAPYSGAQIVDRAKDIAARFRAAGAPVVCVHVGWSKDGGDRLKQKVDRPNPSGEQPADWSDFVGGLVQESDLRIFKAPMGRLPWHRSRSAAAATRH